MSSYQCLTTTVDDTSQATGKVYMRAREASASEGRASGGGANEESTGEGGTVLMGRVFVPLWREKEKRKIRLVYNVPGDAPLLVNPLLAHHLIPMRVLQIHVPEMVFSHDRKTFPWIPANTASDARPANAVARGGGPRWWFWWWWWSWCCYPAAHRCRRL